MALGHWFFSFDIDMYHWKSHLNMFRTPSKTWFQSALPLWGCLFNKLISNFLSHLLFNCHIFLRRVTALWWRGSAKNKLWTNQNSRNNWYQIVRRTICLNYQILIYVFFLLIYFKLWILLQSGSSCPDMFYKKSFPRNFAKFTIKHLRWSYFFYKSYRPMACNLSKKILWTGAFVWILQNFLEHLFHRSQAYLESCGTSMTELFSKNS